MRKETKPLDSLSPEKENVKTLEEVQDLLEEWGVSDDSDNQLDTQGDFSSRRGGGGGRSKRDIARRRVERLPRCGSTGSFSLWEVRRDGQEYHVLKYHPHSCGSVFCPYCAWRESKELFSRLERLLEVLPKVAFLTLTFPSFPDPASAVDYAYRVKSKFYQKRLFGKKVYPRLRARALELLEVYLERLPEEKREEARQKHLQFLEEFEKQWQDYLYDSKSGLKVGQILNAVWKFELTYTPGVGYHPHWHVLLAGYYPVFLLQALWVECGGGEVIDIRAVRGGAKAIAELTKYVLKPAVSGQLTEDEKVAVEEALIGRRKIDVWGLKELEYVEAEQEDADERVMLGRLWWLEGHLVDRENLHDIPRVVRELRRRREESGETVMSLIARVRVFSRKTGREEEYPLLLDDRGSLWVGADITSDFPYLEWLFGTSY